MTEEPVEKLTEEPAVLVAASTEEPMQRSRTFTAGIGVFAIKACIVAALVIFATTWIVDRVVEDINLHVTRIGGAEFWAKVERGLDDAAKADLPPAKKQKLLHDLEEIVTKWRPFVDVVEAKMKEPTAN